MCDASQGDRRHIPCGMCRSQNAMGSPKSVTSRPETRLRCAAAASPYGPAPTIAMSHRCMGVRLPVLPREHEECVSAEQPHGEILIDREADGPRQLAKRI